MLQLLDLKDFSKGLTPITAFEYFTKEGFYHPQGLFSEVIFGPEGTRERRETFSYIELHTKVIHPTFFKILKQLDRKIEKFLSTEEKFSLDSNGVLQVDENGVTGYSAFIEMFPKINFRGGGTRGQRDKFIKLIKKSLKEDTIFIDKIPVISPEFRPIYKDEHEQLVEDKLNEKYLNIMKRVKNIRNVQKGFLYDLICYGIHQSVLDHNAYILTKINKKTGLIRQNLLGKRTDFSGRGVITPDPKIGLNQIGIPFRMAVGLFEPFIIYQLSYLQGQEADDFRNLVRDFKKAELSIESVKNLILSIRQNDKIPDKLEEIIWNATQRAMKDRVIMAKRDPSLHDLSYRGLYPVLVHSQTLLLCPAQVGGFNADFDGDEMSVFHPLSNEAQQEIKDKMMRFTSASTSDSLSFGLSKEMLLGLYVLTKDGNRNNSPIAVSDDDLDKITDLSMMVKYRDHTSRAGRAIFNKCFPSNYPYINKQVTKKNINSFFEYLVNNYDKKQIENTVTCLQKLTFKWATISGSSFSLDDIKLSPELLILKKKLVGSTPQQADKILKDMETILLKYLENSGLGDLTISGAAKGVGQVRQIMVAKGLIADGEGNLFPAISESYADGLTNTKQFEASYGVRVGIIDRVVTTAETGYTARKLAYFLNRVEVDPHKKDCGTDKTLLLKLTPDFIKNLTGRYIVEKGSIVEFDKNKYKVGDVIKLRSPIYCKSPKICHTCYGKLIERIQSPYVGIYAAQKLGEAGTQTSMKKFHSGGAVSLKNKDVLGDILNNDPTTEFIR